MDNSRLKSLTPEIEYYENGNVKKITYFDKKNGQMEKIKEEDYFNNGQKEYERFFSNNELNGPCIEYYENGGKKREYNHKNGVMDGVDTTYYENGQKRQEGTFKDGEKDGKWTRWYENGQKKDEGTYKDGELISTKRWNEDGSVKE
jgi:antitoxin component YwqK of YwqJK toxin-antitoxin module